MQSAICFHGVITPEFLGSQSNRAAGRGWYHHWMYIDTHVWMRVGTPCTFIASPDVDRSASAEAGEVKHQLRLACVPGHLHGVMPEEEAIAEICAYQFRDPHQAEWLRRLTQSGRTAPQPQADNQHTACVCPIQTLMAAGCCCGAVALAKGKAP